MSDQLLEIWGDLEDGQLAEFVNDAPVMLHSINVEGYLLQVNNFWADRLGYVPSEMIGKRAVDFMTDQSRKYTLTHTLPEFLRVGKADEILYQFVHRDGSIVPVFMSAIAKYNEDGSFSHSLAIISEAPAAKIEQMFPVNDQAKVATLSPLERLRNVTQALRVLVAEDNEMNKKVIQAFLHPTAVEATYVLNGEDALEPIIACTALSGNDSINRFMDVGFDRYLPKPISVVAFADCLEWIGNRQAEN